MAGRASCTGASISAATSSASHRNRPPRVPLPTRLHVAGQPRRLPSVDRVGGVGLNHRLERARDDRALLRERVAELHKIGKTHAGGDARLVERGRPAAAASVRRGSPAAGVRRCAGIGTPSPSRSACARAISLCDASACSVSTTPRTLQRRLPTGPDQLMHLRDELDLADAAGAELHVVAHRAAAAFRVDAALHLAQRLDRAEVEVAAEHERLQVARSAAAPTRGRRRRARARIHA